VSDSNVNAEVKKGRNLARQHYREEGSCNRNPYEKMSDAWWGYREISSQKLREEIFGHGC